VIARLFLGVDCGGDLDEVAVVVAHVGRDLTPRLGHRFVNWLRSSLDSVGIGGGDALVHQCDTAARAAGSAAQEVESG
jgi:hypothetical protein